MKKNLNQNCYTFTQRDGLSRFSRFLGALDPTNPLIDERKIQDFIKFAEEYAAHIRFFEAQEPKGEKEDRSWKDFFQKNMAFVAAELVLCDASSFEKKYQHALQILLNQPTQANFKALFIPILEIAALLNQWHLLSNPDFVVRTDLELLIGSSLKDQLLKALMIDKGFLVINKGSELGLILEINHLKDNPIWAIPKVIPIDETNDQIYEGDSWEDKLKNAALYVDEVFNAFYKGLLEIKVKADHYLQIALEQYPKHPPHIALFLAFLRLKETAQTQLNGLTQKHLDFYYKDVLHLQEKPPRPDQAYLIFELASQLQEYLLEKNTAFTAGEDALEVEQIYQNPKELRITQAKVKELKTVFVEKGVGENVKKIYANPVANSKDGLGKTFETLDKKWLTFGGMADTQEEITKNLLLKKCIDAKFQQEIPQNPAEIGFAIASPQLVLGGGNRKIVVTTSFPITGAFSDINNTLEAIAKEYAKKIKVLMTGEKGWLEIKYKGDEVDFIGINQGMPYFPDDNFETGFFLKIVFPLDSTRNPVVENGTFWYNIELHIGLPLKEQAIVAFDAEIHKGSVYSTKFPVLKILSDFESIEKNEHLNFSLPINPISISVQVGSIYQDPEKQDGLKKLILQNNNGLIDPNQAFDPFTLYPVNGANFYIGAEEIANKKLNRAGIIVSRSSPLNNQKIDILNQKKFVEDTNNNDLSNFTNAFPIRKPLNYFDKWTNETDKGFVRLTLNNQDGAINLEQIFQKSLTYKIQSISLNYLSRLGALDPEVDQIFHIYPFGTVEILNSLYFTFDQLSWSLILNFENFLSIIELYPNILPTEIIWEVFLADWLGRDLYDKFNQEEKSNLRDQIKNIFFELNPETAFIRSKNFKANVEKKSQETGQSTPTSWENTNKFFFQPINNSILKLKKDLMVILSNDFLPQFRFGAIKTDLENQYSQSTTQAGNLYIGIENLEPPQNLSLLFQFAEGTEDTSMTNIPKIHWSYLTNNEWRPLSDDRILSDSTNGFQNTGIVLFDIPEDTTNNNTVMTPGLHWLAISVDTAKDTAALPMLIDVIAQATTVKFVDQSNDPARYLHPLPADSITQLVAKVAAIKQVKQPFASFDAQPKQVGNEFYAFASERLRHKARAITTWDYEHLVLERFSEIFKVKCIPFTDTSCGCGHRVKDKTDLCCSPQISPGHVLIIPIANLRNRNAVNILEPKTGRGLLNRIEAYLQKRTSPYVQVHVANPRYEQVLTEFKVKFYEGIDKGFHLRQLDEELIRYLTPWAFDDSKDVAFNGKVYASDLIDFIEERDYVDFITDFKMYHCKEACCKGDGKSDLASQEPKLTVTGKVKTIVQNQDKFFTDFEVFIDSVKLEESKILFEDASDPDKFKINDVPTNANLTFRKKGYMREVIEVTKAEELLIVLKNLNEIKNQEELIEALEENLIAETLIEASKPGAILVSAKEHKIKLYDDSKVPSPCERK